MLDKKFEDRYLDPDDVLIGAEQRLEEMAKQERYALREAHELRRPTGASGEATTSAHPARNSRRTNRTR